MEAPELVAALRRHHIAAAAAWQKRRPVGWHVVLSPSEYHPQGWTARVTTPHPNITQHAAAALVAVGYRVEVDPKWELIEAWPIDDAGAS